MELPRQPEPVTITFTGDPRDVDHYLRRIMRMIEAATYDNAVANGPNILVIYPAAVND